MTLKPFFTSFKIAHLLFCFYFSPLFHHTIIYYVIYFLCLINKTVYRKLIVSLCPSKGMEFSLFWFHHPIFCLLRMLLLLIGWYFKACFWILSICVLYTVSPLYCSFTLHCLWYGIRDIFRETTCVKLSERGLGPTHESTGRFCLGYMGIHGEWHFAHYQG